MSMMKTMAVHFHVQLEARPLRMWKRPAAGGKWLEPEGGLLRLFLRGKTGALENGSPRRPLSLIVLIPPITFSLDGLLHDEFDL